MVEVLDKMQWVIELVLGLWSELKQTAPAVLDACP